MWSLAQKLVAPQSASITHVFRHALPPALQPNGAQPVVIGLQLPTPLQAFVVRVPLVHVAPGHSRSGSVAGAIAPQVPSVPLPFFDAEQAWQVPVQALPQQTLSTQCPAPEATIPAH